MAKSDRVVILVDMDCFYCQVEEQLDPSLKDKPIAVVQYNAWRGGGIIAVNYPARDVGVTRHMRGDEAKEKCPDIQLVRVPEVRGKADLTKYRDAGKKVAEVLQTFTTLLERASVDEAYLDVTDLVKKRNTEYIDGVNASKVQNTYVVGSSLEDFLHNTFEDRYFASNNVQLAIGAVIAEEIRAEVFKSTGYRCSAGIAHNKILAKLVCGLHKPNKQTVLPHDAIYKMYENLPVKKIRSLGGKFGNTVSEVLGIQYMGELTKFTEKELIRKFDEKTGTWLYNIARGIDNEPVTTRLISKSIGCCKKFPGRTALRTSDDVEHWIDELSQEISERLSKDLEENNRKAKQMVVSFSQEVKGEDIHSSRTHPLTTYEYRKIAQNMLDVIRRFCMRADGSYHIKFLGLSVGNFEEVKKVKAITSFFKMTSKECQSEHPRAAQFEKNESSSASSRKDILTFLGNMKSDDQLTNSSDNKISTDTEMKNTNANHNTAEATVTTIPKIDNLAVNSELDPDISIWSAKTEDLSIDPHNLIYYDESQNEKQIPLQISNVKHCAEPILNMLEHKNMSCPEEKEGHSGSFFQKYFDTKEDKPESGSFFQRYFNDLREEKSSDIVEKQFDTSISLESHESDSSKNNSNKEPTSEETATHNQVADVDMKLELVQNNIDEPDSRERCPKCGKSILKEDLVSHMDYHYVLQIVKEEKDLYRAKPSSSREAPVPPKTDKKLKRLKNDVSDKNTVSIKAFLPKNELTDDQTELCVECNRRIKLDQMASHLDYHVARRLHIDLNSVKQTPGPAKSNSKAGPKKKGSKKNQTASISTFFRPR